MSRRRNGLDTISWHIIHERRMIRESVERLYQLHNPRAEGINEGMVNNVVNQIFNTARNIADGDLGIELQELRRAKNQVNLEISDLEALRIKTNVMEGGVGPARFNEIPNFQRIYNIANSFFKRRFHRDIEDENDLGLGLRDAERDYNRRPNTQQNNQILIEIGNAIEFLTELRRRDVLEREERKRGPPGGW